MVLSLSWLAPTFLLLRTALKLRIYLGIVLLRGICTACCDSCGPCATELKPVRLVFEWKAGKHNFSSSQTKRPWLHARPDSLGLFCPEPMNTFTTAVCFILECRDLSHLFALLNGPHYITALLSSNEAAKRTVVYFLTFRVVHYSASRTRCSSILCRAIWHGLIFAEWFVRLLFMVWGLFVKYHFVLYSRCNFSNDSLF
jgi:hypothetical protein